MKRCLKLVIFIFVIYCFSIHSTAENSEYIDWDAELQSLYSELPNEVREVIGDNNIDSVDDFLSFNNITSLIIDGFRKSFSQNKYSVFLYLALFVFIGEIINKSLRSSMARLGDLAILLVGGISVFELLNGLTVGFIEKYTQISAFASSVAAVSIPAMASTSSGASATALGAVCTVLFSMFNYICSSVIIPFVNIYLCVNLSGAVTGDFNLRRTSSFLRNTSIGIISLILSLYSCIMSVQSTIAMTEDTLLKKTLKQILSTGLPVLGTAVSDGMDTLFTSVTGIKNSVGVLGIVSTVIMSVYPIIDLFVCFLFLSLTCFLLSFFEGISLYGFMASARDIISVLLCITLSLSIMIVLIFYFIIKVV